MFAARLLLVLGGAAASATLVDGTLASVQQETKPSFLKGEELNRFFLEVEKQMKGLKSIVATFQQEKRLALFKEPLRSSGQILFSTPDHLRWEFRKPFQSVLIVSGDQVAKFEKQKTNWRKVKQGRQAEVILVVMDNIRSWFRGDFDRDGNSFEVAGARKPYPVISMKPKDKLMARSLREVELRLADDLSHVVQVTIREVSGDQTTMSFDQQKRRPEEQLDGKYFSLERVVDVLASELAQATKSAKEPAPGSGESR